MLAVQVMTGLADELDDRLHGEFGGKRFFVEGDKPTPSRGEPTEDATAPACTCRPIRDQPERRSAIMA